MNIDVISVTVVAEGLRRVVVRYRDGRGPRRDQALWSKGKQRKDVRCMECDSLQRKGTETFRPIGNQLYRARRLCLRCAEERH